MGFLFQNAGAVRLDVGGRQRRLSDATPYQAVRRRDPRARRKQAGRRRASEADYDKMPGDLSGGMKKRAAAWRGRWRSIRRSCWSTNRAPASIRSPRREIDDLLVDSKRGGTTLVVVTHNIPSARVDRRRLRGAARRPHAGARDTRGAGREPGAAGAGLHAVAGRRIDGDPSALGRRRRVRARPDCCSSPSACS